MRNRISVVLAEWGGIIRRMFVHKRRSSKFLGGLPSEIYQKWETFLFYLK